MLETDPAKLSPLIADAHKANLDRIQETLTKPVSAERERLSDALNRLRTLRHEVNSGGAKPTALSSGNWGELASWLRVESRRTHQTALAISITPPAN
jgi:hypothetical protein